MNKKHILALLSGTLLLASTVFGASPGKGNKDDANLEKPDVPQEVLERHHKNPFLQQDEDGRRSFAEDKNFFTKQPDVFGVSDADPDPWDD